MNSYDAQQRVDALSNERFIILNPDCLLSYDRQRLRDFATVHAEFIAARDALDRIRAEEDLERLKELERLDRKKRLKRRVGRA